ncbi:MAG TPA: hypothetical protein DCE80_00595 [Ignavibacteriales bacterium]|nr:hypothetical protein [Ignavibacteriales bacterium]
MNKHTKLFYRVIAGIRATGNKNGYVSVTRIKTRLHTGYARAGKLIEELIRAGVLKKLDENYIKSSANGGNILWENLSKY